MTGIWDFCYCVEFRLDGTTKQSNYPPIGEVSPVAYPSLADKREPHPLTPVGGRSGCISPAILVYSVQESAVL